MDIQHDFITPIRQHLSSSVHKTGAALAKKNGSHEFKDHLVAPQQPSHTDNQNIDLKKIKETARDFESFFLGQIIESMFEGIEEDSLFGGGFAEGIYRSMLNQEFAKAMSQQSPIRIADQIEQELIRLQTNRGRP